MRKFTFNFKLFALSIFLLLSFSSGATGLKGTYTIDSSKSASATNFTSIAAALSSLKTNRTSGDVIFEIADGTYNVHIDIDSGLINSTILFQSASGDSSKVIIKPSSGDVITCNRDSQINFNKLTISGNCRFVGSSNAFTNCRINGKIYSVEYSNPSQIDFGVNLTVNNSIINSGSDTCISIYDIGLYSLPILDMNNDSFEGEVGIYFMDPYIGYINMNNCKMEIKKDAFISNNEEVYINKSYISCGGYAFNSYAQNALGNIVNSYIPKGKGINASIGSGLWIHNCTIMAGVDLTIFELGFTKMSNNIIKGKTHLTNLQSDTSLYMYYGANNNCFMNDTFVYSYYYGGTTITFTKLNDWKGYFPWLDSFSFIADPKIASIVDPTPRDSIVFGKGETLNYPTLNYAAIKDDYFGNTRNLNNPTIGCVEAIGRIALNLSGTVKDSRHIAMKNTRVYLVYYDPSDTALKFRDSTYTDSFGYYIFNNVSDTLVHAMAVPDSTKFPMEMPTYADSSAVYNLSRTVHMHSSNQVANIQTLHGLNPGGIGVIRGKVTYCSACKKGGSGTPASRIKMILTDAAGRVQAYTYTDKSGNFTFSKLALKNYSVWVDEPLVDNTKAPIIAVTSSKPVRDSLQFTLYPEFLDLNVTSSIANDKMGAFDMDIYPNPSSSDFTLHYKMEHEARVVVNVTDITGNSVFVESKIIQAGDHTSQIRSLAPGMYFIVLNVDGKIFSRKIISNSGN